MVPQQISYLGSLRCQSQHGPSGVMLVTDAPTDNQGKGESFSPTDLVVTALATCVVTTAGILAQREGVQLEGTKVYAEKHISTDSPRRIFRIVLKFDMPAGIPASFRPKFETISRQCPVQQSLHPDIVKDITINYPD